MPERNGYGREASANGRESAGQKAAGESGLKVFETLGAWVIAHRRGVLVAWLLAALVASIGAGKAPGRLLSGSGDIAGSQSRRADSLWRQDFSNPYGQALVVAIQGRLANGSGAPADGTGAEGEPGDSLSSLLRDLERKLLLLSSVSAVMSPDNMLDKRLLPKPGSGTLIMVGIKAHTVRGAEQALPELRSLVNAALGPYAARDSSMRWAVTGRAALTYDLNDFNARDTTRAELRVIPLTLLILLFAFGSVVAAGIPVILGMLTTVVSMGIVYLLAGQWAFSNLVQNVSSMVGLAVGIDYSLFLIHRFREALARGDGNRDAALLEAMATAGKAIFLSGLTVLIGLGSLTFTPLLETQSIGWGGCLAVLVAVALSLSFLPALVSLLGKRLDWPPALSKRLADPEPSRRWRAWSRGVLSRAPLAAVLGVALILALSWPGRLTRFGFPEGVFVPAELEFSRGHAMLTEMGLEGLVAPINIILASRDGGPALTLKRIPALHAFSSRLRADSSVARIFGPVDLADGWPLEKYRAFYADMDAVKENTPFVQDYFISRDGSSLLMQVMLVPGTPLEKSKHLAGKIPGLWESDELTLETGGQAVYYNDFDKAMKGAYPLTFGFVVGITFLTMLAFFRSLLASLKAIAMNTLSVLAGYGAVVWVFQLGHLHALFGTPGPTEVVPLTIPLMLFCLIFGLSMDYEVILLSRIRERFLATGDNNRSIEEGLASTGGMITSAALVMVAVFGAFAFAGMIVVQMLGLGLAVAVLVDATIIRSLLVPALMKLAGKWNWWPGIRTNGK